VGGKNGLRQDFHIHRLPQLIPILCLSVMIGGCVNPAKSSLPPSDIQIPEAAGPNLPKGDVYADENEIRPDMPISPGDTVQVIVRTGAGEDKEVSVVREDGSIPVAFKEIKISGMTTVRAEAKIAEELTAFYRNPRVQVQITNKKVRVKQIFVFGEVKKPGMIPLARNMTVLHALSQAGNYNETAILDEIRIIRRHGQSAEVLTADIARLLTHGDWSKNLPLKENDVVYIPRTTLGDAKAYAETIRPLTQLITDPLFTARAILTLAP